MELREALRLTFKFKQSFVLTSKMSAKCVVLLHKTLMNLGTEGGLKHCHAE